MMESKVFADNFSRSFSESGDFFQFLSARQARSKWMTAPSKELRFEPVERGSTLGNLYMQIYDHNGDADVLEDTMENTSLLLKVDGKDYPVRSCALKTVLERARISGHALNKVSKSVFAEILNYCMGVASGDSLIKVADEKVSAVHGGDPKDYTVMEMLPLFKATNDFLNREYPRGQKAVITYTEDGHTEEIVAGATADALGYEVEDMEQAIAGHPELMKLELTEDVMKMMTRIRKDWGLTYPEEERATEKI